MLECLVIGDSIAVGVSMNRPDCSSIARVGITSQKWLHSFQDHYTFTRPYKVVVISLSTNDYRTNSTSETLYDIRSKIKANMVIWILPNYSLKPVQRTLVREIANEFHDKVLEATKISHDGIHPTSQGYKELANKITEISNKP